jgi:hypothetical protein
MHAGAVSRIWFACPPAPQLNMQADGTSAKLAKIGPIRRAPFLWRAT